MKKEGLKSTIVIGIFLVISTLLLIFFLSLNLKETLELYADSIKNSDINSYGEVSIVIVGLASAGLFAIVLCAYASVVICIINSAISLFFAIKNSKSPVKPIRVVNYVYDIILVLFLGISIVKLILFAGGIA